jgi:hypothetical protein
LTEDDVPVGKVYQKKYEKKYFFCILKIKRRKESNPELDPDPDPLVSGTDLVRIHTKMSRIPNSVGPTD